jgi:hypothetical protein
MIDITAEDTFPLRSAPGKLPSGRNGQKIHPSTLFRWCSVGIRGVRLETIAIGGMRCSSLPALQRFFERLELARQGGCSPQSMTRSQARRKRESRTAAEKLAKMGA